VERDVTLTGGCAVLGVHAPTTSGGVVPQLLAVQRRNHHVLLQVGESASPSVIRAGSAVQTERPTSFQPPLRRCVASTDDKIKAGPGAWSGRSGKIASRTWRHVTSSAAASRETGHDSLVITAAAAAAATVWWTIPRFRATRDCLCRD